MKKRLDALLVARHLASSLKDAEALIMAGQVLVNDAPASSKARLCAEEVNLRLRDHPMRYVSRGGMKLEHALRVFNCDVKGKVCLDVGASTGGFTDCLLQHGAVKVYAVDVGYGQLHVRLQRNPQVVVIDRTNIRFLDAKILVDPIDIVVMDLSFISAVSVMPVIDQLLSKASILILVKPQFELESTKIGKGGIVRSSAFQKEAVHRVEAAGKKLGWISQGSTPSPLKGAKGNQEYFLSLRKEA